MQLLNRSKNNYKYRRRNKSGGDSVSDTETNDAYWRKRRQNIIQSLEAQSRNNNSQSFSCSLSNSSTCSSSTTPLIRGQLDDDVPPLCTCKRLNCPKCRSSPSRAKSPISPSTKMNDNGSSLADQFSCQHQGSAQTKQSSISNICLSMNNAFASATAIVSAKIISNG